MPANVNSLEFLNSSMGGLISEYNQIRSKNPTKMIDIERATEIQTSVRLQLNNNPLELLSAFNAIDDKKSDLAQFIGQKLEDQNIDLDSTMSLKLA